MLNLSLTESNQLWSLSVRNETGERRHRWAVIYPCLLTGAAACLNVSRFCLDLLWRSVRRLCRSSSRRWASSTSDPPSVSTNGSQSTSTAVKRRCRFTTSRLLINFFTAATHGTDTAIATHRQQGIVQPRPRLWYSDASAAYGAVPFRMCLKRWGTHIAI